MLFGRKLLESFFIVFLLSLLILFIFCLFVWCVGVGWSFEMGGWFVIIVVLRLIGSLLVCLMFLCGDLGLF